MGNRGTARRRIGVAFAVGAAAMTLPFIAAAPAHAAETISSEGSVTVESFPSTKQIELDQFDDNGGLLELTSVKVTGTVEGELEGSVENLSATKDKTLNGEIAARIDVEGPGVTDLKAEGTGSATWNLAPGETQPLALSGSDSSAETVEDPETLALFVGDGTVTYDVFSEVDVQIDGPAPYKTTGVAGGEATVKVEYTYTDICAENPDDPVCVEEPVCETSQVDIAPVADGDYAIPGGGTFTISNYGETDAGWTFDWSVVNGTVESITVQGGDPLTTVVTEVLVGTLSGLGVHGAVDEETGDFIEPTNVIVCAASDELPPPECVTITDKIEPVTDGPHELDGGGTFTIEIVETDEGPTFNWDSNVLIYWVSVKGGPVEVEDEEFYDYRPDGATSDDGLHAPLNPNNGKWYGLSHLTLCAADLDCEATPDAEGCSSETDPCLEDRQAPGCEEPTCETNPEMEGCGETDPCVADPQAPGCEEPTCETDPSLCEPEPECTNITKDIAPELGDHDLVGGGTFTITKIYDTDDGQVFDWESDVLVHEIHVKGGPNHLEQNEGLPAMEGEGVHAEENDNNGKWFDLSHIDVCADELVAEITGAIEPGKKKDQPAGQSQTQEVKETPAAKVDESTAPKQEDDEEEPEPEPQPDEAEPEPEKVEETPPPPPPAPVEQPAGQSAEQPAGSPSAPDAAAAE